MLALKLLRHNINANGVPWRLRLRVIISEEAVELLLCTILGASHSRLTCLGLHEVVSVSFWRRTASRYILVFSALKLEFVRANETKLAIATVNGA